MKKGAWKYFRPGDDFESLQEFIDEHIGPLTVPNEDIEDSGDERYTFKQKIRIVIDIFDENSKIQNYLNENV